MTRRTLLPILAILLAAAVLATPLAAAQTEHGPATDKIIFIRVPRDKAVEALLTGKIDVYLFGLRPAQAAQLIGNPKVKLYTAPSGIVDIILNPAPVEIVELKGVYNKTEAAKLLGLPPVAISYIKANKTKGTTYLELCVKAKTLPPDAKVIREAKIDINPFCFRQIRFAMNYLIDRSYIVNQIYRGFAYPMYIPYSPADPIYVYLVDIVARYKFGYNPQLAQKIVSRILTEVGAVKKNGIWYYNGKPITIIGIIRVEDERRIIGDMFAHALESLGFQVTPLHLTFGEAIPKVYFTDPMDFQWSFYTEGWGKGGISKWDPWTLTQFAAPWFGWMPGWGEPSYWNYKNETIDKLTKAAALGKFKSKEEFIKDIREATLLALQESVRIWVATVDTIYPANAKLQGITLDLGAGLRPPYNGRSWYIPGKDTIVVGHNWVWTSATIWNPIGGFQDVYSVDPALLTYDPLIWNNPFNGEPMPFRATYTVKTAGPNGYLPVPKDAVWWDAVHDRWVPAYELGRTKAKSVVIFDFSKIIGTKFHDGSTITWGDILAAIVENLEVTYDPVKSKLESAIASSNKPILDKIVAIRILPDQKKIEVYLNYWHFDPNYIADYAVNVLGNGMYLPAPIWAMMDYLAFTAKKYAYGETRSEAQKIPQLSLVEPEQIPDFKKTLEKLMDMYNEYKNWFIVNGVNYLPESTWKDEIEKALKWIDEYNNAWISDGPYKLVLFDKNAQKLVLEAFRDPTYPFGPMKWALGKPIMTKIVRVLTPVVSPGEPAKVTVEVKGEPPLHVIYLIRDPTTGRIIAQGKAKPTPAGTFVINLPANVTSRMAEYSAYELIVIAYSDKVALPDEKDVTLQTGAAIAKRLGELQKAITKQVEQRLSQVQKRLQEIQKGFEQRLSQLQQQLQAQLEQRLGKLGKELASTLRELLTSMTKQVTQAYTESTQTLLSQLRQVITQSTQSTAQSITSLASEVKSVKSSVDTLTASITSITGSLRSIKSDISQLRSELNSIKSSVGTAVALSGVAAGAAVIALILAGIAAFRRPS